MTWVGITTSICLASLAVNILVLIAQNWAIHRTLTRVFCLVYPGYLLFEASITLCEPVTVINILSTIITVGILCPLIIGFSRLLRLGDFFQLASQIQTLREQVAHHQMTNDQIERLEQLNSRIEQTLDGLDTILKK